MVSPWGLMTMRWGNLERGWRKGQAHKKAISNNDISQLAKFHHGSGFVAAKVSLASAAS
jgi:galactokinase/mevalonate kinase-like predicted kinase